MKERRPQQPEAVGLAVWEEVLPEKEEQDFY
jgi:hypothetical protein